PFCTTQHCPVHVRVSCRNPPHSREAPPMTQTKATEPVTAGKPISGFDRYFQISSHGSNIPRELRAGFTTWLTMSYILFVNPQVLSSALEVPNRIKHAP